MIRKWTDKYFSKFVEENSNCKLISKVLGYKKKVKLKCKCGNEFETTVEKFVLRNKRQCNECGLQRVYDSNRYTTEEVRKFIEQNNCELISKEYKGITDEIKVKCSCGEIFTTTFDYFKNGNKRLCNTCSNEVRIENLKLSSKYVENYIKKKGCTLLSDYVDIKSNILIKCKCGEVFETTFDCFKSKEKTRCDKCSGKMSSGERIIDDWLTAHDIEFKRQYRIKECRYKKPLPFDFAVFKNNELHCLIEYDGEQHFNPYRFKDNQVFEYKKLKSVQERDKIKNQYCKCNNIELLRISYKENIIDKLESTFS